MTPVPDPPAATVSPAVRAIGVASIVIAAALGLYCAASAVDDWPAVVLTAFGAALGAGVAINAIVAREYDEIAQPEMRRPADPTPPGDARATALMHQLSIAAMVASIGAAGVTENPAWFLAALAVAPAWVGTLRRLAMVGWSLPPHAGPSIYARAFEVAAVTLAIALLYAAIAMDTPWLWRPTTWDDYQAPIWLVILEFASLALTLRATLARR